MRNQIAERTALEERQVPVQGEPGEGAVQASMCTTSRPFPPQISLIRYLWAFFQDKGKTCRLSGKGEM